MSRLFLCFVVFFGLIACSTQPLDLNPISNPLKGVDTQRLVASDLSILWGVDDSSFQGNPKYADSKDAYLKELERVLIASFQRADVAEPIDVSLTFTISLYRRIGAVQARWIEGGGNTIKGTAVFRNPQDNSVMAAYVVEAVYGSDGGLIGAALQGLADTDVESKLAEQTVQNLRKKLSSKR